jgi:hypothetical protein
MSYMICKKQFTAYFFYASFFQMSLQIFLYRLEALCLFLASVSKFHN